MVSSHPQLIFGGGNIGQDWTTRESVEELLQTLKSLGISRLDTAPRYPTGRIGGSERLLGETGAAAQDFAIDTKILVLNRDASGTLEPPAVAESLQASYDRLHFPQDKKVHVLYCHAADPTTPLEEQAAGIDAQYRKGLFDQLGVSNFPLEVLAEYLDICEQKGYVKPTVCQNPYNLVSREAEQLIPSLRKHGVVFNAYSPLAMGFLSGKLTAGDVQGTRFGEGNTMGAHGRLLYDKQEMHNAIHFLTKTLEPYNISKPEAALRWLSYHSLLGPEDGIILGASKIPQLEQNVQAIKNGPLPDEVVSAIDSLWKTLS
ncbi:putative aldo/keto reductase [Aspergillus sclerotioniger CBS 115572]|uniref:Putative aldo/keto reductase n=1 Tax=Aspergillus sclerotioniger CBS 115572 TaxID=1450535 RepID=A0A317WZ85_9EURO|nr:putative aldo/keto reductase [Aspergillus sclerotioniger CBS 115572]PWY91686.1 putative aldo/keto reductase [Aspergillus sclerotioniger CBS 115572]